MRILSLLEFSAIVPGTTGIIAGQFFGLPKGLQLGVFLVGAGLALGGLESVLTRRVGFRSAEDSFEAWDGAPAMIVGLMALLIGATLIGCAYLLAEGLWRSTLAYLARRPGLALIGAGLVVAGTGALMMFDRRRRSDVWWTLLVRVPCWTIGFIVILAGFAAVGLGTWECVEPDAFDRFVTKLPRELDWRAWERWWKR